LEQIRDVGLRNLACGTICKWVENYTPHPLSLQGKCSRCRSCYRLEPVQSGIWGL
jgi:hypothetical protein